ncbi:SDR family NAD(P)-dependent oxidoreductase [Streptomyces sp. NPDC093085]|uniref:SDR family NAD(P)-dependent oxidoreductase n=1 Tax=Streptomyces sp. NPDC093085 TaxID=3155068 RepID=UPI00342D93F9
MAEPDSTPGSTPTSVSTPDATPTPVTTPASLPTPVTTPITTRFTASSTADEVLEGVDLTGVRAIVTGASSGLGAETARALTAAGAEVTLAVRNTAAGEAVAGTIARPAGGAPPRVVHLDLADRTSVTRFVTAWSGPLHLLINNAGVVTGGLERTREGWESQFATNHLGHFALATGLHDALARGASERDGARIVSVSSTAHMRAGIDFEDLHFERRAYDPQIAYAQSKTANALFAVEATRRWASDGIVTNAVNPGGVATGLQRNFTPRQKASLDAAEAAGVFTYKTVGQGAATTVVAAVAPEFARSGGHYLDDGREAYTVPDDADLAHHPHGVKEWALDPATAERLWTVSAAHLPR